MKEFFRWWMSYVLVIFFLIHGSTCKNPDKYRPDYDSLLPPPPPPLLLSPPDSFVHMPLVSGNRLLISWEHIEDAEIYEIHLIGENHPEWTIELDTNFLAQNWANIALFDKYTWKVRAYSQKWEYYTDWSKPRIFTVSHRFPPPIPLYPPGDTIFYTDSLPISINFEWSMVSGAQYYYLRATMDTTFLFEIRVTNNHETVFIEEPGIYYWQILAGSKHWEYDTGWSPAIRFTVIKNKKKI
ncbi:MAG: hypothetical protein N3A65_09150 [candidate division WOR-3 bacterium]|nr:hypothetical protein [candidate division WOR-3 bacterium]